jgi:citrate lyase subunit beta/citryl-CoA lyase
MNMDTFPDATTLRSMLFVPALQERFIHKAAQSDVDAVILDLEDSIPFGDKAQARERIAEASAFLAGQGKRVFVRINSQPADAISLDVAAAAASTVEGLLVPKAENPGQLVKIADLMAQFRVSGERTQSMIPIIESPVGLLNVAAIAQAYEGIAGLAFGSEDFALEMEGGPPAPENMTFPAQQVAVTAKAYQKAALGLPGSIAVMEDMAAFRDLAVLAKKIGMTGVLCIHPKQVVEAHAVFTPTAEEIQHAETIKTVYEEAAQQGIGAIRHEGRMIDLPHYRKALRILKTFHGQRAATER